MGNEFMHCALEYYSLLTHCTRSFLWKAANPLSTPPANRPAIYHPWRSFLWKAANPLSTPAATAPLSITPGAPSCGRLQTRYLPPQQPPRYLSPLALLLVECSKRVEPLLVQRAVARLGG